MSSVYKRTPDYLQTKVGKISGAHVSLLPNFLHQYAIYIHFEEFNYLNDMNVITG